MSSWLGGLGSGLGHSLGQVGGSLSSFTGQISNFTKDMLLEGVEEVGDTVTELQVSNSKLTEVEAAFAAQKYEFDRLKKLQAEVEEKLEASELQVKRQSAEYRTLLQQKDVELNHLKARQIGLQEELQKLQRSTQSSSSHSLLPITSSATTTTTDPVSSFLPRSANSCHSFQGDDMDLSDAIWSQHEINRLSAEVVRLEAEAAHWRQISQASTAGGAAVSNAAEIVKLQRTIKELREEMNRGVEDHQHELAALQDAQHQKMSDFSRRHREELGEYEERIEELEEQIHSGGASAAAANTSRLLELQQSVQLLQQEKDDAQEENAALLLNYMRLQASVAELQSRVQEQEGRALQKAQLEQQIQQLKKNLTAAEQEVQRLKKQKEELKEEVEHADILELNTIITTLKQDKASLHQEKLEMEQRLREAVQQQVIGSGDGNDLAHLETVEDLKVELQRGKDALKATQKERDTLMSELETLDQQNQQATQHLISVKEQLSGQLKKAELELFRLTAENSDIKDCNSKMQQELDNHQEKLSQSDFMLNEQHMSLRELKDKLELSEEHNKEVCRETVRLKKMLQDKDEQLAAVREELELSKRGAANETLQQSHLRGAEELLHQSQVRGAEEQLLDLQRELEEMGRTQESLMAEDFELKIENQLKLKARHQEKGSQASLSRVVRDKDTCIDALKLQKQQLQDELQKLEKTLAEQARQYQQTIEELRQASSMDASSLQTEHERIVRLNQDKDLEIAQLKRDLERLVSDHSDTNEMLSITVAGQKQLTDLLQEKDTFMDTFKQNAADLQAEMEIRVSMVTKEAESLRQALEEKERQLGDMKEENSHLKEEMDRVGDQQSRLQPLAEPRTLDIITELETEITELKSSRSGLEEEVRTLRRTTEEQQGSLQAQQSELEQANARYQQTTLNYDRLIQARDQDIGRLQQTLDRMSPPVILQEEKTHSLSQENGSEKHDFSKAEIEKLVKGIKEKEIEISQLNEKNLSLTRQLDQLVVSREEVGKLSELILQKDLEIQALHARVSVGVGSDHSQDVIFLQQQLQAYAVEREQVLAVLNEKTRENSQLRTDYHRLMEILSGKEASLLKLQQENQRLSNMSDSSGSQEMFKETIQNLSRIIREKDIEIDALTQKCQTLVTVLQSSGGESGAESGGVSSNQFEELLQERDTLKQQVKKMEEWKQQVITTVKNMQHESAQLQEELIRLQAQVSTDSDCSSQLSDDYARLIHSYEQKELQLGSLSQELIQVKQTINQLSSTKEVLLGKLGSVASPLATATPIQNIAPNDTKLQEILASLREKLAEREDTIRTLQENNHRLSDCLAVGGEHRDQAMKFPQPIERLEALQRSLREKDLLIKTKGDQLGQVSEMLRNRDNDNELLKQAVTNLKERALVLELDVKKLKEDNDLVAARSREKESEFRALQETNMQVSLLLREKEFELSAMSNKAATVEKMLKDKEQGKSGELNQLLNEIKSMQEKAVRFQQERDQVMMALKQKQMETTALQAELQHVRDKEQRSNLELERLRNHLLEIEDSYTREALAGEDREAELRRRAAMLEEKLASSSSAVENASQQASMQVESLQEQLNGAVAQRDGALAQLRTSQEQVNQYAVSLSNLQMVLEQFQQEEKAMYTAELEKLTREKEEWRKRSERLQDQTSSLQINLDEANAALDSASRLTDQLDLKEEQIEELKKQVDVRQEMLEEAQKKLMNLLNSTEGKIDKVLMRNLLLGYFHTPKTKRSDVLKLMGSVLGLSRDDLDKMLLEDSGHGVTGWVSSWLGSRAAHSNVLQKPTSVQVLNSSFSEMFVKFLEIESNPSLPAPKLPVQDIKPLSVVHIGRGVASSTAGVRGRTSRPGAGTAASSTFSDDSNPFLAPRSAAIPLLTSSGPGSTAGHLLMKPISDALPTFTPVPVSAEASGGTVLKDLLKQ